MANRLFNEQMTSNEARIVLFRSVEGKSKPEIDAIKKEYSSMLPLILKRELNLAEKGWLFG